MVDRHLFTVIFIIFEVLSFSKLLAFEVTVVNGVVGKVYTGNVNRSNQIVYKYDIIPSLICLRSVCKDTSLRLEVKTDEKLEGSKCPTHFAIRQNDHLSYVDIPVAHFASNVTLYSGARTLCVSPEEWEEGFELFITVSTCSPSNVSFSTKITSRNGYTIGLNELVVSKHVSSAAPVFYRFQFPEDKNIDTVTVLANSTTHTETILSIQPLECPVRDERSNIKYRGRWHTMSRVTSLVVQRKDFPGGFFIVFLPDESQGDYHRNFHNGISQPEEKISFRVKYVESNFVTALLVPPVIFIIIIVLSFVVYSYSHQLHIRGSRPDMESECGFQHLRCCKCDDKKILKGPPKVVEDLLSDDNIYKYLRENSYRYFWTMFIVAVFFVIPLGVLMLNLFKVLERTGELDTCNFNYFCSHQILNFASFNNMYSTIGFGLFGPAFILFVHKRAIKLIIKDVNKTSKPLEDPGWTLYRFWNFSEIELSKTEYGAYQNFGIYYTLGFAMFMAGILKAVYNSCPNRDTAFFGTSFMFVILVLCQIKIYNLRHPSMVNENFTFGTIAVVITSVIAGCFYQNRIFQIVISILMSIFIQLTILIISSAGYAKTIQPPCSNSNSTLHAEQRTLMNSNGDLELQSEDRDGRKEIAGPPKEIIITSIKPLFVHIFCRFNYKDLFLPSISRRIFALLLRFIFNVAILWVIWVNLAHKHFSFQMYVLFLINFELDFVYYFIIMKCLLNEYKWKISWQPLIHLVLAIFFWVLATYYLFSSIVSWQLPSILFQENYKDCVRFGFYDVWDMYQLTVAPALFFTFMVLLTADDYVRIHPCDMTNLF